MKTIVLKLTKSETKLFDKSTENTPLGKLFDMVVFKGNGVVEILDVDKFREFLNDEIDKCFPTDDNGMSEMLSTPNGAFYEGSESQKQDNLKSILSKLDKAVVQNDDDGVADGLELDSETNYLNNNDEPKCTKCGSEFEDEIWKTPATDYEEYICSNDKCCAVHTINIETHQFQPQLDIERFWDTLEFSYIWEQGLKNDEPKGDIGVWDIKFYREDDEGNQTLYEYNGDCSVFSDMVDEDDLTKIK